ncbi:MAG: hypothetical protein AAFQ62_06330 [Pseudomonadota bacterium]
MTPNATANPPDVDLSDFALISEIYADPEFRKLFPSEAGCRAAVSRRKANGMDDFGVVLKLPNRSILMSRSRLRQWALSWLGRPDAEAAGAQDSDRAA